MQWDDEAIILAVKPLGETAVVAELFTRGHGRHLGLVQGGRSRRIRPVLQTGNHVTVRWTARLDAQLGQFSLDLREAFAAKLLDRPLPLLGIETIAALIRLLPERDPHPSLFEVTLFVAQFLDDDAVWPALLGRWELALLEELGFGLDLTTCAATGVSDDLIYVSPRSGRAVSAQAGAPYQAKLLTLPAFLCGNPGAPSRQDIQAALKLTGYFLEHRVLMPQGGTLPEVRERLVNRLSR
jgi:DNA repair protein RecO (recombination protein O)